MGWAKYEEDNREAMEERWAMRDVYRPVVAYSNDHSWHKQNAARYPATTYPQQKTNTSYSYRAVL